MSVPAGSAGLPSRVSCPESPERRPADVLRLGEQRFVVVGTVLLLVKMLLEYCDCARHLGAVSGDLLSRLVRPAELTVKSGDLVSCPSTLLVLCFIFKK